MKHAHAYIKPLLEPSDLKAEMRQALSQSQSVGCQKHAVHLSRRSPTLNLAQRGRRCRALSLQRPPAPDSHPEMATTSVRVVESPVVAAAADVERAYQAGYEAGLRAAQQQPQIGRDDVNLPSTSEAVKPAEPQIVLVHDSLMRSIIKSTSWRVFSTATTIFLTMTMFHATLDEAVELGAAEFVSKYILYFIHERIWIMIPML